MAGFLRKKSKNDAAKAHSASNPHQIPPSAPAPLFSRFATTNNASNDPHKVVVSGPMSLSAVRRDSASVHSTRNAPPPERRRTANAPPTSYDPRNVEFSSNHGHGGYQQQPQQQQASIGQKNARYSLSAQQPLAPVIRDKPLPPGDPYTAYRRSVRAPQPVYPDQKPLPVEERQETNGPLLQPRSSVAGTNTSSFEPIMNRNSPPPNLTFDPQGRHSPLIDLPPEIALFQVSLVWIVLSFSSPRRQSFSWDLSLLLSLILPRFACRENLCHCDSSTSMISSPERLFAGEARHERAQVSRKLGPAVCVYLCVSLCAHSLCVPSTCSYTRTPCNLFFLHLAFAISRQPHLILPYLDPAGIRRQLVHYTPRLPQLKANGTTSTSATTCFCWYPNAGE